MVYVRPDILSGTVEDQADLPPPQPHHDDTDETDEEPDVEDIEVNCQDNNSNCVNDNIAKVLEVYDEETCLETMRGNVCVSDDNSPPVGIQDTMRRPLTRLCLRNVGVLCRDASLTTSPILTGCR